MAEELDYAWRFRKGDMVRLRDDPASIAEVLHRMVLAGESGWDALQCYEPSGGYSIETLPEEELVKA